MHLVVKSSTGIVAGVEELGEGLGGRRGSDLMSLGRMKDLFEVSLTW